MLLLIRFPCGPTSFFLSETPSPIRSEAVSRTLTHALASNAAHSALPVDMSLLFRNHDRKKRLRLDREHDVMSRGVIDGSWLRGLRVMMMMMNERER